MQFRVFSFGINVETLWPQIVFKLKAENCVGDIPAEETRSIEGGCCGMKGCIYSRTCPDCACCIMMTKQTAPLKC